MTKLLSTTILLILICFTAMAVSNNDSSFIETPLTLHTGTGDIFGTLTIPKDIKAMPVALIIAGSGPTDRNCNGPMLKTEAYKKLAYELAKNNIASLRYDKRGIAESHTAGENESDLRFDDYVNDARGWIQLLKHDKRFSKVIVVGHSEGSLIGMIAAGSAADKFISIAGVGQSADKLLKTQLADQPAKIKDLSYSIIDSLVLGKTIKKVDPMLYALFRPSVQPYMISWFQYDPQVEIKKLNIPVMLIQGTNDIQVSVEDVNLLAKANPKAQLLIIENMNHIFRIIEGDRNANIATYNNPSLPISNKLTTGIVEFIKQR